MAGDDAALLAGVAWESVHSFTVADYDRMAEVGILSADDRVELIDGVIVSISPTGAPHFAVTLRLDRLLKAGVGGRAVVSVQGPVRMPPHSEPQPDLAVLKARLDDYEQALPEPNDVLLLIEVADTTLAKDRDVKALLYARHGIAEYWLVDIGAREVVVHRDPAAAEGRYRSVQRIGDGGVLDMAMLAEVRIPLSAVFRPAAS